MEEGVAVQVEGVGGLGVHAHVVDQLLQGLEQVGVVLLVIFDQFAQGVIGETAQVAAVCALEQSQLKRQVLGKGNSEACLSAIFWAWNDSAWAAGRSR